MQDSGQCQGKRRSSLHDALHALYAIQKSHHVLLIDMLLAELISLMIGLMMYMPPEVSSALYNHTRLSSPGTTRCQGVKEGVKVSSVMCTAA